MFYVAGDGTLTAVPVTSNGTTLAFGPPARLFPSAAGYQAAGDGQRFLLARPSDRAGPSITVVLNWLEGLKELGPCPDRDDQTRKMGLCVDCLVVLAWPSRPQIIIVHWFEELRLLVPVN